MIELLRRMQSKIQNILCRGLVLLVSNEKPHQELQTSLLAGEVRSGIERLEEYGFTSYPFQDAESFAVFLGGNRDNGVIINVADVRYRPRDLKAGEIKFYNFKGTYIHFDESGSINVFSPKDINLNIQNEMNIEVKNKTNFDSPKITINATSEVSLNSPNINITGNINLKGKLTATGDVVAGGISLINHTHTSSKEGTPTTPPL
jgi:phage baseplate assembly protein V